jgi:hypothetical protein
MWFLGSRVNKHCLVTVLGSLAERHPQVLVDQPIQPLAKVPEQRSVGERLVDQQRDRAR